MVFGYKPWKQKEICQQNHLLFFCVSFSYNNRKIEMENNLFQFAGCNLLDDITAPITGCYFKMRTFMCFLFSILNATLQSVFPPLNIFLCV